MLQITRHRLSNGMKLLVIDLPHLHSVELGMFVKAGPRFEGMGDLGLSHFTEHMFFRGTRGVAATFALHAEVERLGSPLNALTSRDYSQYYFALPPRHLERGCALFSEIMLHPTFESIDVERQIILEEYLGDLNEHGEDINPENHSRAMLWPDSTLGMNILGTEANIRRFSQEDLFRHHKRHYTGENSVVYFAGACRAEQAVALAEKYFARYPAGEALPTAHDLGQLHGPRYRFINNDDSQDHLSISFLAPSYTAPNYLAMVALQNILAEGMSSRLQWNLCERLGMVYDLDAGLESYFDTGVFDIEASASPDKLVPLFQEIVHILRDLREQPVDPHELEKARERYRMGAEFACDNPSYLATWMASTELYLPVKAPEAYLEQIDRLTASDLQATAREVFHPSRMVAVITGRPGKNERKQLVKLIDGDWAL